MNTAAWLFPKLPMSTLFNLLLMTLILFILVGNAVE